MDIYVFLAYALCVLGIIGCVVPILPGPWLAYLGILVPFIKGGIVPAWQIWSGLILCVIVTILDYIVPILGTKKFNGSKYGIWGCTIGTIIGLFFLPIGIIAGPFIGAVIGELYAGKKSDEALRAGLGSFFGFLAGTLIKVIVCFIFIYYIAIQ